MISPALSVIVPIYREGAGVETFLRQLHTQLSALSSYEIIVVDGEAEPNSSSGGVFEPSTVSEIWVGSPRGRALQMNRGAELARSERLIFLHCDTHLPPNFLDWFAEWQRSERDWGFFTVRLSGHGWPFRMIERAISWRSTWSHISTGDQAQFVTRAKFDAVSGFPNIELMEDVALSARLRADEEPFIWRTPVATSSRRWERRGVMKTIVLMWWLRLAFALGVSPKRLAGWYRLDSDA